MLSFQKYNRYLLLIIILLSAALRFIFLGNYPVGFHQDEAYLGYNAYSVLKTGQDLSGNFLPIHIESFLYSPAGYMYAVIPAVYLFGLTEFAVRFPSALFGTLSVLLVYLISLSLFNERKDRKIISIISALFFAVMPWNVILSRTATENSIVTFLVLLSILIFYSVKVKNKIIKFGTTFALLACTYLIYQAPRAFIPFFAPLLLLLLPRKTQIKNKFVTIVLYFLILILPILLILSSNTLNTRIRTLSLYGSGEIVSILSEQISRDGVSNLPYIATRIFHNKYVLLGNIFLENYFSHFSYSFLFTENYLPERYIIPQQGILYLFFLPLLIFGTWRIFNKNKWIGVFLILWILISPIGSSLTFDDTKNIQRTLFATPAFAILAAFGLVEICSFLVKKTLYLKAFITLFIIVFLSSLISFIIQYFYQAPFYKPWLRQDGYMELIKKINEHSSNFEKVVITNRERSPTIFLLFYNRYDPLKAQMALRGIESTDKASFDKYEITEEECPVRINQTGQDSRTLSGNKGVLYVNSGLCDIDKFPSNVKLLETIYRKDGSKAFFILEIKQSQLYN